MGVITSLIRANREKKAMDEEHQLRAFTLASQSDDPALKQWGIRSITELGEKNAPNPEVKKHIPVLGKIAGLMGQMNPVPKAPKPIGGPAPEYSQERADAEKSRQTELATQRQSIVNNRATQDELTSNELQRLNYFDELDKSGLPLDEIAEAKKQYHLTGKKPTDRGSWEHGEMTFPGTKVPAFGVTFNKATGMYRRDGKPYTPPDNAIFKGTGGAAPTMRSEWVQVPGEKEPRRALIDPKNPNGYLDEHSEQLPEGTRAVATPQQQRLYGAIQGYYYDGVARGMNDADARKHAGEMFMQYQGATLGRLQQNAAMDEALSSIPLGPGFRGTGAKPTGAAGAGNPGAVTPGTPKPTATTKTPLAMTEQEQNSVNMYLGKMLGTTPGAGGKAFEIGALKGQRILAKRTGLDPMTLNANLVQNQGLGKALKDSMERAASIQRINETLDKHGDVLVGLAKQVLDTGSPLLTRPLRSIKLETVGDPTIRKYMIALNAVQREYAYLTAGGAQSRAMLPVTVSGSMENMFEKNATLEEVVGSIQQVKIEAQKEQEAMVSQQKKIVEQMQGGAVGQAVGSPGQKVKVQIPGQLPGEIPADKLEEFKKAHPNAKVGQ